MQAAFYQTPPACGCSRPLWQSTTAIHYGNPAPPSNAADAI
ncbi:hypothetical protein LT85_1873 [Collimonas arenae]|uniref:Uncharacterized protein n=1 Tax=Collimonas arenae TaxID=279058 RepID=A0A0A1F914_9BURK|nr:hypothetical protein LT85_1873 [Collimonas arenae]